MDKTPDAKRVRWRPYITTKDGRKIWAKWYGLRAFPIQDTRSPDDNSLD